jgi:hypothetical protein
VYKDDSLYHRAAMIIETLTMFYNSEKEVGPEGGSQAGNIINKQSWTRLKT